MYAQSKIYRLNIDRSVIHEANFQHLNAWNLVKQMFGWWMLLIISIWIFWLHVDSIFASQLSWQNILRFTFVFLPTHDWLAWRTEPVKWLLISMVWTQVILRDWWFTVTSLKTLSWYMQNIFFSRMIPSSLNSLDILEFSWYNSGWGLTTCKKGK